MSALSDLLDEGPSKVAEKIIALGGYVRKKQPKGGRLQWTIQCPHPTHPDSNPSATLSEGIDGSTLMYCFGGGCPSRPSDTWFRESIQRLRDGIPFAPAKPKRSSSASRGGGTEVATYRYWDADRNEYNKVRYDYGNGEKRFEWRTMTAKTWVSGLPNVTMEDLLPYGSEQLSDREGQIVYWVEGEKDANRAHTLGHLALSSPAGATGPLPDLQCLTGRIVLVIADRDPAGLYHARQVMDALKPIAEMVGMYGPKPTLRKSDLSDHLDAGYTMDDLEEVIPLHGPTSATVDVKIEQYTEQTLPDPEPTMPGLLPDTFWAQHPTLRAIRSAAASRMLRPEPILASILVTAITCTSPKYVLPPIVGAPGSLNLFTLLYGSSGMGKSTSLSTARNLLGVPNERWDAEEYQLGARGIDIRGLMTVRLGSGEGIAHAFAEKLTTTDTSGTRPKAVTRLQRVRDHVLIADSEGSALAAHQGRAGATIGPVLLSAFSGEPLLSTYSKRGTDSAVDFDLEPLSYRLGIILGIQPDIAGHYLEQAGTGWPQRLLWMTVHGPLLPEDIIEIQPLTWSRPPDPPPDAQQVQIEVAPAIADQLRQQVRTYRETGSNPLDSHAGLLRLKVAAAIHVLLNPGTPPAVTPDDWAMATEIVSASDMVRGVAQAHVINKARDASKQRAEMKAHETVAAQRAADHDQVQRVAKGLARIANKHAADQGTDHWCSGSACLRRGVAGRDRGWFEEAVEYAVERGLLEADGSRYRSARVPQ